MHWQFLLHNCIYIVFKSGDTHGSDKFPSGPSLLCKLSGISHGGTNTMTIDLFIYFP